ncbi:MAG: UDP-N-acetylmuramoyl-tripeptide--D-alanyl-D-alanine ligase [Ruminococcaceae bacterium]|nr:UDP-N-acetylmuramoyl-tripeptide--D-alanyl-D-alanine ligase [Oscillospiraceae bacterium]
MKMKPITLEKIAEVTGGKYYGDDASRNTLITSVVRDNRDAEEGSLFVCLPGANFHGHDFVELAYGSGAVCCLAEKVLDTDKPFVCVENTRKALADLATYYRSLFDVPFVGITGSVGKTTSKEMTAAVLSKKFNVLKTTGNLNNEIGVPLTLLSLREEHTAAVIEMGISDFGEMCRLSAMVKPDICLMSNIGYCHLENLGDLDGVLKAKAEVYEYMSENGVAVVNGDDEKLGAFDPGLKKITYGLSDKNDLWADNIKSNGLKGVTCDVHSKDSSFSLNVPAFGSHIVLAALAAGAIAKELGVSDEDIAAGVMDYAPVKGRANAIDTGYITIIDDCYNANPNSVSASLLSLSTLEGRKVAILGDMFELGKDSKNLHREIGLYAGSLGIDSIIALGNHAEFIYKGMIASGSERESWFFPMKDSFYSVLPSLIKKGDTVLVKASHGMHFEEIVEELKKLQ